MGNGENSNNGENANNCHFSPFPIVFSTHLWSYIMVLVMKNSLQGRYSELFALTKGMTK